MSELNVVTGAFGYTGKYITRLLLSKGKKVKTLTGHPARPNPFGIAVAPFNFENPKKLTESLKGAKTLYNTYWVRFPHGQTTYDKAVENTKILVKAAQEAGVSRFVHISITGASEESPLPYFAGKGVLEKFIMQSGISYAIIRPTVIFGPEDILINNIAWLLRKLPLFAALGKGDYKLQPIFVGDMADITVNTGQREDNMVMDAVGPEIFTFDELVRLIALKIGSRKRIIHLNPSMAFLLSNLIGYAVGDVLLTKDEVKGLVANLLISKNPPTGKTHLSEWLEKNAEKVGKEYASELRRHYQTDFR